jgi:hypothetical protein
MQDWVAEHEDDKGFLSLFNKKYIAEQRRRDIIETALSGRRDNVSIVVIHVLAIKRFQLLVYLRQHVFRNENAY